MSNGVERVRRARPKVGGGVVGTRSLILPSRVVVGGSGGGHKGFPLVL